MEVFAPFTHSQCFESSVVPHVAFFNLLPLPPLDGFKVVGGILPEELAKFWDSHDVTDFEDDLEEVVEPVFVRSRGETVNIELPKKEFEAIKRIAQEQHIDDTALIRTWVLEKLYYSEMMRRIVKDFQTP